ncbi:protein of unknown function [Candidatus Methylomirabilis oxygeniifera]|uniref:Uncharacterized protein n=1 Tax=Methylomirabilis oxygeniifera TaxID=671143 RepID=D5MJ10_METO1|nr:protein of unknown function [Candidatus Methylomirabilis oxyfera]
MKAGDGKRCTYVSLSGLRQRAARTKSESINCALDSPAASVATICFLVSRCSGIRRPGSSTPS